MVSAPSVTKSCFIHTSMPHE
ncbi:hypothetical protein VTP21DRAFT_9674, partial [Calcarisporiella thermophila]